MCYSANIINGAIEYMPNKTKDEYSEVVRVPLNKRAKALVDKYNGVDVDGRLFPFNLADEFGLHESSVKHRLEALVIERRLKRVGPDNGEYWVIIE